MKRPGARLYLAILELALSMLGGGHPNALTSEVALAVDRNGDACGNSTSAPFRTPAEGSTEVMADLVLTRCYLGLGNYAQAVAHAKRAVELHPGSSEGHRWLGQAYGLMAEREHSIWWARRVRQEFEAAVRLDAANLRARRDLMEFYLEAPAILGGGSVKAWQQAEAIATRDAVQGHLARAAFWTNQQQPARAELELKEVFHLHPQSVEPYLEIAEYYQSRKDARAMKAAVEAASSVQADDPRLPFFQGVGDVISRNRFEEAERLLETYLSTSPPRSDFPSHASAHLWLGRLYEHWGKTRQAVEEYRSVLRLDPHRSEAREALHLLKVSP